VLNTMQAAEYTGIPADLLAKMRVRPTTTLQSPPFRRVLNKEGVPQYCYSKAELKDWMAKRNCLLTAGEAAMALGISRDELLSLSSGSYKVGKSGAVVVVYPNKNIYLFRSAQKLRSVKKRRVA